MLEIYRKTKIFVWLYLAWLLVFGIIVLVTEQNDLHRAMNEWNHILADYFFKYITQLGGGLGVVLIAIGLFFYKVRWGIIGGASFAVSGLISQFFKRVVFEDHFRPYKFFKDVTEFHFIDGVDLHNMFSFPSGHATSAFSIFFLIAFLAHRKPFIVFMCFVMALAIAESRVYLSFHYTEDILAGSAIGVATTAFFLWFQEDKAKGKGQQGLLHYLDKRKK